jgi:hypothetical protein
MALVDTMLGIMPAPSGAPQDPLLARRFGDSASPAFERRSASWSMSCRVCRLARFGKPKLMLDKAAVASVARARPLLVNVASVTRRSFGSPTRCTKPRPSS